VSVDGSALVAQPEFGDVELQLPIEPSAEAWSFVEQLIAGRSALCRAALGKADVPQKIRDVLARGVRVTLPRRLLERPLRLPLAVEREVVLAGPQPAHRRAANRLDRDAGVHWYGVRVELGRRVAPL
jgi:hypothetical protein